MRRWVPKHPSSQRKEPIPDARPILARPFASPAFPVRELVLFQSFLKPTGPVYEALGRYPLAQSPATSH